MTSFGESLANLVRLHSNGAPGRVTCVGAPVAPVAEALSKWVPDVRHWDARGSDPLAVVNREEGKSDVLVLVTDPATVRIEGLRRLLRPGGLVLLCVSGPRSGGRKLPRQLAQGGFEVRVTYLVTPSFARPEYLIPDEPDSIAAYIRLGSPPSRRRLARITALRVGWRPREFTGYLIVAAGP